MNDSIRPGFVAQYLSTENRVQVDNGEIVYFTYFYFLYSVKYILHVQSRIQYRSVGGNGHSEAYTDNVDVGLGRYKIILRRRNDVLFDYRQRVQLLL
jgi:hypothetical protein